MKKLSTSRGFTLIELMITMAIVGILALIAIPSYRNYVITARRAEAEQELTRLVNVYENCFSLNNTYSNCLPAGSNPLSDSVAKNYVFTPMVEDNGNSYWLTLTLSNNSSQKGDKKACQTLTISSLGRKYSGCSLNGCRTYSADTNHCW